MQEIGKWLIGFIITFTLLASNSYFVESADEKDSCYYKYLIYDSEFYAICENITYLSTVPGVPQHLWENITVLEVVNTDPLTLNETSFVRYPKLKRFLMVHPTKVITNYTPTAHEATFLHLTMLEDVFLTNSGYHTDFKWPSSILKLGISGNKFTTLNVINLSMLKELHASDCGLTMVPKINESASLTVLDLSLNKFPRDLDLSHLNNLTKLNIDSCGLRTVPVISAVAPVVSLKADNNPMDSLTAEELAHYCLLQELILSITIAKESVTAENYCQCSRVEKWIALHHILDDLKEFFCPPSPDSSHCNFDLTDASIYREECLIRHGKRDKPKLPLTHLIPALGLSVLCIFFLFFIIRHYVRRAARNTDEAFGSGDEEPDD